MGGCRHTNGDGWKQPLSTNRVEALLGDTQSTEVAMNINITVMVKNMNENILLIGVDDYLGSCCSPYI
jgi:hypothetical protein